MIPLLDPTATPDPRRVGLACSAWLVLSLLLALLPGPLGLSAFHLSVWAVAAFSYFLPGPRALLFGLAAAGLGLGTCWLRGGGKEFYFLQTSVLVVMGFLPTLFSRAEERRRLEQEIITQYHQRRLEALHAELGGLQRQIHEEVEKAKAVTAHLKRLAE